MNRPRLTSRGFTLVELMISLGIALLLIYGINFVFRAVTDVVRAGNALSTTSRQIRNVDASLQIDIEGTENSEFNPITQLPETAAKANLERRWSGIAPILGEIDPANAGNYVIQPRQPAITIFCKRQIAFFSKADEDSDTDKLANTADEDDSGTESTDFATVAQFPRLTRRAHRVDTIGFFSGGSFIPHAVRGSGTDITSTAAAPQAWLWYGHVLRHGKAKAADPDLPPDDLARNDLLPYAQTGPTGKFFQPGEADKTLNPRNHYAVDWSLGRMAMTMLLRSNSTVTYPGIPTLGRIAQRRVTRFYGQTSPPSDTTGDYGTAIAYNAAELSANPPSALIYRSTPPDAPSTTATPNSLPVDPLVTPAALSYPFTSGLNDVVGIWPGTGVAPLSAVVPTGSLGTASIAPFAKAQFTGLVHRYQKLQDDPNTTVARNWWQRSTLQLTPAPTGTPLFVAPLPLRFNSVSAFNRPASNSNFLRVDDKSALQSTYLATNCTQFVVEFAGDFVSQNGTTGDVTSPPGAFAPDGVVDFEIVNGIYQTQWYGLPRDVDGDGIAGFSNGGADNKGHTNGDVVPVFNKALTPLTSPPAFPNGVEKGFVNGGSYIVAFGPKEMYPDTLPSTASIKPSMLRFIVSLTDPAGNLAGGLTREFVFRVR